MSAHAEAKQYLAQLNPQVRKIATQAHKIMTDLGCSSYVKTIYIGYDIGGEMVAALYGRVNLVEIALALDEDTPGELLVDASHLTWRTLPLAAHVKTAADLKDFQPLAALACTRVNNQEHHVERDNKFFANARKERKGR